MIVVVPPDTPVTSPGLTTVATAVLLLVHVPPKTASLSTISEPSHTEDGPLISAGVGLTVTVVVAIQPKEYVIVAVPAPIPVTRPPDMVATDVLLLLHAPPGTASLSVNVEPIQIVPAPTIAPGSGLTVMTLYTVQPEPSE